MYKCSNEKCNFAIQDRDVDASSWYVKRSMCKNCQSKLVYVNEFLEKIKKYKK